jgi:hypothetical protein
MSRIQEPKRRRLYRTDIETAVRGNASEEGHTLPPGQAHAVKHNNQRIWLLKMLKDTRTTALEANMRRQRCGRLYRLVAVRYILSFPLPYH